MVSDPDALIVGAGVAGLACARHLSQHGLTFVVLEAADGIGGRVRTDKTDGFLLDRGFQVLLSAYPEVRAQLDLRALDLHPFYPGALIWFGGRFHRVADPLRRPLAGLRTLFTPIGSLADKLRMVRLAYRLTAGRLEREIDASSSALNVLRALGFSDAMIDRFFRPFIGGVFLDRELRTDGRTFAFIMRMFAAADAALPAAGIAAVPEQMASRLPRGSVRLGARIAAVEEGGVQLASGERLGARFVVLATDAGQAADLLGQPAAMPPRGATCLYFAADRPPIRGPYLVLNGTDEGPVNSLCVPSEVAATYAPSGQSLVSATLIGAPAGDEAELERAVRGQMLEWFGPVVHGWRHLKTYRIAHAQPARIDDPGLRQAALSKHVYLCGDHREQATLEGAMRSGRRVAEAIAQKPSRSISP